ncbi:MAG: ABC transporter substrate-binding protein, partial [Proteobacteria bacterium]
MMNVPMLRRKIQAVYCSVFRPDFRPALFAAGLGWVVLISAGCTNKKPFDSHMVIQIHSEPTTLDPIAVEDGLGFRILSNLYRGLFQYDSRGELKPDLAERAVWSPDGKTLTVFLKKGPVWSDGAALKTDEILFAFERAKNPKLAARFAPLLSELEKVEALPEGGVRFHLTQSSQLFMHLLTLPMTYPLRREWVDGSGHFKWRDAKTTLAFSAPYRLNQYARDQYFDLEAWAEVPALAPRQVRFQVIQDESTGTTLLKTGELDVLSKVPLVEQNELRKTVTVMSYPFMATNFLAFKPDRQ